MDINKIISAMSATPQQTGSTTVNPVSSVDRGAVGDPGFQGAVKSFAQKNNPFASSGSSPTFQGAFNNTDGKLGDQAMMLAGGEEAGRNLFLKA